MPTIQLVTLPRSPLYRVGRPPDPFVPPEWRYVRPDGTFGGRYDDPHLYEAARILGLAIEGESGKATVPS